MMSKNIKLWERQPRETAKAFTYFQTYLELGIKRSHTNVAKIYGTSLVNMSRMARKWEWKKRVEAWTDFTADIKRENDLRVIQQMNERHAQHAQAVESALMSFAKNALQLINDSAIDFNDIKGDQFNSKSQKYFSQLAMLAERLPRILDAERKARGEPTEINKHQGDFINKIDVEIVHTNEKTENHGN